MGAFLKFLPKLIPFLPQLAEMVMKLIGVFKKDYTYNPESLAAKSTEEVKLLKEHKASKKEEEWNIVRGED